MGFGDLDRVLTMNDLARGENIVFSATGITDGDLVHGVRFFGNNARTHSIVLHSRNGTVRHIESVHRLGAKPVTLRR
jgi:fructose-1,6-bisphosphatase II